MKYIPFTISVITHADNKGKDNYPFTNIFHNKIVRLENVTFSGRNHGVIHKTVFTKNKSEFVNYLNENAEMAACYLKELMRFGANLQTTESILKTGT